MGLRRAGRAGRWAIGMLLAAIVWGCGDDDDDIVPDGGGGQQAATRTVTGFIGDITSALGVAGARVVIGAVTAVTNASGQFVAEGVPRVDQTVVISADDYETWTLTLSSGQDQIVVRLIPEGYPGIQMPPDAVGLQ